MWVHYLLIIYAAVEEQGESGDVIGGRHTQWKVNQQEAVLIRHDVDGQHC